MYNNSFSPVILDLTSFASVYSSIVLLPPVPHHHALVAMDSDHCVLPLETCDID